MFPDQQRPQFNITHLQIALLVPEAPPAMAEQPAQTKLHAIRSRLQRNLVVVVRLNDSQSALDDLDARFTQIADPDVPAVERLMVNGVAVLNIRSLDQLNDEFQLEAMLLRVAAPNNDTLVFTFGDEAQLTRAMAPSPGAAGMSTSETVRTAVRMLPKSTASLVVLDFKPILREILRAIIEPGASVDELMASADLDPEEAQPAALGMSWRDTDLDVHLAFPAEIFPFVGRAVQEWIPYFGQFNARN